MGAFVGFSSLGWDDTIRTVRSPYASSSDPRRKRRFQDDTSGGAGSPHSRQRALLSSHGSPTSVSKRVRTNFVDEIPIKRRLESLDRTQLLDLLESLVERHPEVGQTLELATPKITADRALKSLRAYYERIIQNLPFKGDQLNDYAYLRVKPQLDDFFRALADYLKVFLPPHSTEFTQSLEFLNGATEFIHNLPEWSTMSNNDLRNRAYVELGIAWSMVFKELSGTLQFSVHGAPWIRDVIKHNERSGGRMGAAVDCVMQEYSSAKNDQSGVMAQPSPIAAADFVY